MTCCEACRLPRYLRDAKDFMILPGTVWQDLRAPYRGRRGVVVEDDGNYITLAPLAGLCPCPRRQRTTRIRRDRFDAGWGLVRSAL